MGREFQLLMWIFFANLENLLCKLCRAKRK